MARLLAQPGYLTPILDFIRAQLYAPPDPANPPPVRLDGKQ